ncbi:MAG: SDR family oxidoreductase [Rhodobacteraceae bacterium]|nr:SDR family oxidoreductase [Paracoccaceae bacterium]
MKAGGTVLITGAGRGLGAELSRQYRAAGWDVVACARRPAAGEAALDLADDRSIAALAASLAGRPIDVLIHNAAIRGDTGGLATLDQAEFLAVIHVNAFAPLALTAALLPNLLAGRARKIAHISSRVGSMTEGMDDDGDYAYRMSKAALNLATVKLAHDYRRQGITALALHPGWIRTDMGGPDAETGIGESAAGLIAVIEGATLADSGSFRDFRGRTVAW